MDALQTIRDYLAADPKRSMMGLSMRLGLARTYIEGLIKGRFGCSAATADRIASCLVSDGWLPSKQRRDFWEALVRVKATNRAPAPEATSTFQVAV